MRNELEFYQTESATAAGHLRHYKAMAAESDAVCTNLREQLAAVKQALKVRGFSNHQFTLTNRWDCRDGSLTKRRDCRVASAHGVGFIYDYNPGIVGRR